MGRRRRHSVITLLFCWMTLGAIAQPTSIISEYLHRPEAADSLLKRALDDPENAANHLDLALNVSQEIGYDDGVTQSYERLINHYRKVEDPSSELRTQLFRLRYFTLRDSVAGQMVSHLAIGDLYFNNALYDKAVNSYENAVAMSVAADSETRYYAIKQTASSYYQNGAIIEARDYFDEAIALALKYERHKDLLWLYQQKASVEHDLGLYDEELQISLELLKLTDSLQLKEDRLKALNNLGFVYKYLEQPNRAEEYFAEVLKALSQPPEGLVAAEVQKNLGILYQNESRYPEALTALKRSAIEYQKVNHTREQASTYDFLALVYYQNSDTYNAHRYNDDAVELASKKHHLEVLQNAYHTQSVIYEGEYDYEAALASFKKHLETKTKLEAKRRLKQNELNQQQYFLERMDRELKLLWASQELKDLEIRRLRAEGEAQEARNEALQKESELAVIALRNEELRSREATNRAELAEQRLKAEEEKRKNEVLAQEKKLNDILIQQAKSNLEQEKRKAESLAKDKRLGQLELEQKNSRIRNMAYLISGLFLLILLILFAFYQLRKKNHQIASQQTIIAAERDKSDELLLNILPPAVAAELKEHGSAKPRSYDEVSVVFTDFSGFTKIAESLSPSELVETLDKLFLQFDLIAEKHGMQRIKTIGDAYMCACGLPEPIENHARRAVTAALEMRDFIDQFNEDNASPTPWRVRIGVNSGPVVAGVVGIRKFAYDIWGDAVNIASRMESSGTPGKVNISQSTYGLTKGTFAAEHRGKVEAKNKGEIDMYYAEWPNKG